MSKIWETKGIYILSALLILMILTLFCQYIFSDRLMLFTDIGGDSLKLYWPSYVHCSRYLHREGIPKWTFEQGLGQNIFPANLGDVPAWLLLIVAPANIPFMLPYMEALKIFLAGLFFFLFLRKIRFSAYTAITGALIYSFSGFMIIGSAWFTFSTEGCYLAFLLYGLELLRQDNNLLILPLGIALIAAFNPVLLYLDSLLIAAYLFFSLINNTHHKSFFPFIVRVLALGGLGVMIGSFLMLGSLNLMMESPRGSGSASFFQELSSMPVFKIAEGIYYKTFLLRLFGNDMGGYAGPAGSSFQGWNNYLEAPMQYCSLLSLLLLPQLFVLAGRKTKILSAICLSAVILPVIFPYFRYAFWLFQGDYFRTYSLFFGVLQILLSLKALDLIISKKKISLALLGLTLAFCLFPVLNISLANKNLRLPVVLFLVTEAILLGLMVRSSFRSIAFILLLPVLALELVVISRGTLSSRGCLKKNELVNQIGYQDHSTEAIQFIRQADKGFYRLQKGRDYSQDMSDSRTFNQSLLQDYYGLSSYHPFNQKYYINFQQKMGLITDTDEWETRMIHGLGLHPQLSDLVSVKYLLMTGNCGEWCIGYDSIADFSGLRVFRNRFFLPLGFTYSNYISEGEMSKSGNRRDFSILHSAVVNDSVYHRQLQGLQQCYAGDTAILDSSGALSRFIDDLKTDTLQIASFSQNHISGYITTNRKKLLFFSIPFDKGWKAEIDGKEQKAMLVNYGFLGYILYPGVHHIQLNYSPPYYYAGMSLSILGLLLYAGLSMFTFIQYRKSKS